MSITNFVPFTESPAGHIILDARVNGVAGQFILDSGAGLNLLTKRFADTIPALAKTERLYTGHRATGERLDVELWQANHLEIGDFMSVTPSFAVLDIDFPFAGLISLMPFREQIFTVDYSTNTVGFDLAPSLPNHICPLSIVDDRSQTFGIFAEVTLNDMLTLQVKLDSGAGRDVFRFNAHYLSLLNITETQKVTVSSEFKLGHQNTSYRTNLKKLITPTGKIRHNVNVTFIEGLIYEGIVDTRWLGNAQTYDLAQERLILT